MKKELRMLAGIILHPVRMISARCRRNKLQYELARSSRARTWAKNHERMHNMAELCGKSWTGSDLADDLYMGAVRI